MVRFLGGGLLYVYCFEKLQSVPVVQIKKLIVLLGLGYSS